MLVAAATAKVPLELPVLLLCLVTIARAWQTGLIDCGQGTRGTIFHSIPSYLRLHIAEIQTVPADLLNHMSHWSHTHTWLLFNYSIKPLQEKEKEMQTDKYVARASSSSPASMIQAPGKQAKTPEKRSALWVHSTIDRDRSSAGRHKQASSQAIHSINF